MKQFYLDGVGCGQFGMMATGAMTYNAPERDVEKYTVPGRNGDLIVDNGRYHNLSVQIPIAICRNFPEKAMAARQWLRPYGSYRRLEDDWNPDTFRLGMFRGPVDFDVKFLNRAAEATLEFDCKPQRFLKSGEQTITLTENQNVKNLTDQVALPLLKLYGTGSGSIDSWHADGSRVLHSYKMEFTELSDGVILDSETMNAYRVWADGRIQNYNSYFSGEFIQLHPGDNLIGIEAEGLTRIEIIPRWWVL